jgi:hypothetical protein
VRHANQAMMLTGRRPQFAAVRWLRETACLPQMGCALALIALLMLPTELRAGTERPHPHSLFQLLIDASDGKIDHHAVDGPDVVNHHGGHAHEAQAMASESRQPDLPVYSDIIAVSASLAALATIVALLSVPAPAVVRIQLSARAWRDRIPALEPPPPRCAGA